MKSLWSSAKLSGVVQTLKYSGKACHCKIIIVSLNLGVLVSLHYPQNLTESLESWAKSWNLSLEWIYFYQNHDWFQAEFSFFERTQILRHFDVFFWRFHTKIGIFLKISYKQWFSQVLAFKKFSITHNTDRYIITCQCSRQVSSLSALSVVWITVKTSRTHLNFQENQQM